MSAVLSNVTATLSDSGATITVTAGSLDTLQSVLARLGAQPANDTPTPPAKPAPAKPEPKASKPPAAPAPEAASPAPTPAPAPSGAEAKRPTYDDVRDRVLSMSKHVGREQAMAALGKFGVDHGNKLKLEDYPAFIEHADKVLKDAKVAA